MYSKDDPDIAGTYNINLILSIFMAVASFQACSNQSYKTLIYPVNIFTLALLLHNAGLFVLL